MTIRRRPTPIDAPVPRDGYSLGIVNAHPPPHAIQTLARVDLNLLVALDVLLRERSVTRAAAQLGLSQPALSASLARLRRYFDDELLTRVGNTYELTALATGLRDRASVAIAAAAEVFASVADFDPASSERVFELYVSDYAASVLAAPLLRLTRAEAPRVHLRLQQLSTAGVDNAGAFLRDHDGMVVPPGLIKDARSVELFTDRFVLLVSIDNAAVGDSMTVQDMIEAPMVVAYNTGTGRNTAVHQMQLAGLEPTVDTVTESFVIIPFLIAGTDRIGLVPEMLARRLPALADVRIIPCPFPVADLVESLWWHQRHQDDPGHRWFRSMLVRAAASVQTAAPGGE
jgi:DNA-binding transcriptional LysR family regulator